MVAPGAAVRCGGAHENDNGAVVCYLTSMRMIGSLALAITFAGCPCGRGNVENPNPGDTADSVIAKLAESKAKVKSLQATDTTMDYWLNGQRAKVTVLIAGMPGAKLRMNALNPVNQSVLFDLMCDGTNFVAVDHQKNCVNTGPCNGDSI